MQRTSILQFKVVNLPICNNITVPSVIRVGTFFSANISRLGGGGGAAYVYSSADPLPAGLEVESLASGIGVIRGSPTTSGTFVLQMRVQGAFLNSSNGLVLSGVIQNCPPLTLRILPADSTLSTGAIVGIAVGLAVFLALVGAFIYWMHRRWVSGAFRKGLDGDSASIARSDGMYYSM